jgi:hypothetical protein
MKPLHPAQHGMRDCFISSPYVLVQSVMGSGAMFTMAHACVAVGGIWHAVLPRFLHNAFRQHLRDAGQRPVGHSWQRELGNTPEVWLFSPQELVALHKHARARNANNNRVRVIVYLPGNGPKTIAALRWFCDNATHIWMRGSDFTEAAKRTPRWPFHQPYTLYKFNPLVKGVNC